MTQPLSRTHAARSSFAFSYYQAIIPYILLITLLCSSTQFAWARREKDPNLATKIADAYLRSFDSDDEEQELTATEHKKAPPYQVRPPKLDEVTKRRVLFNGILAKSKNFDRVQQLMELILNKYSWDDLKLFYGTPSAPGYHLLSRINRTKTTLGEAALASLLATPTSNLEVLRERQRIIQTLLDNPRAVEELERALQTYEDGEQSFLSLWTKTDPLDSKEYQKYMNTKFYRKDNNAANKSARWLELGKQLWRDFFDIHSNFLWPSIVPISKEIAVKFFELPFTNKDRKEAWTFMMPFYRSWLGWQSLSPLLQEIEEEGKKACLKELVRAAKEAQKYGWSFGAPSVSVDDAGLSDLSQDEVAKLSLEQVTKRLKNRLSQEEMAKLNSTITTAKNVIRVPSALAFLGIEILTIYFGYKGYQAYQEYSSVLRNLALRMADVQNFIRVLQQVSETIAASPALEKVYGKKLTSIRKLLAQAKENIELGRLIYYLQHLPFQHWNYFLNNAGKLLASYKLFIEHKDAFADAMYELGQLDTYLSFATLMQESQANDSNHGYTFATFLDRKQKDTPYIKITEMWNPFLDAEKAVGNSIEMDGAPGGLRNMILTGPNAGGKSTYLGAVIICLLFAQTFGILPAQEGVLTPFNKLRPVTEKEDDVAAAQSLFMAELKRAQEYVESVLGLKPEEFSFAIFDELFSGTNPKEGAAAEYGLLYALGAYSNSLSIVATHYPTVMQLEKQAPDRGFANHQVRIIEENKKITYTYKIAPGGSTQAIALKLVEQQIRGEKGFNAEMMEKAQEVLNNPDQYNAEFKEETGETRDLVQYKPGDTPGTEEGEEDEEDLVEYKPEGSVATKD